jgi:hypothetical protein
VYIFAGAVDLDGLRKNDKQLYEQYITQIAEFGQTPSQLFMKPHVKRAPIHEVDIVWPIASIVRGVDSIPKTNPTIIMPHRIICHRSFEVSQAPILLIAEIADKIVTVDFLRIIGAHLWLALAPDVVPPFKIKIDSAALELSKGFVYSHICYYGLFILTTFFLYLTWIIGWREVLVSQQVILCKKRNGLAFLLQFKGCLMIL